MSTDHQRYSTRNQADAIAVYAACHDFEVVRTYADEGRSGLTFSQRKSLRTLLADVMSGQADFQAILVYDVSRWGRFQDTDESAHYEFLCRNAGVPVHYCAEQFDNDGSLSSTILKSVKRMMAAEYSRELSTKIYIGQCRLAGLGFRQGGMPGYGLRRLLIDENGTPRLMLKPGEYKSVHTDRVILVPGPPEEVAAIRRIFDLYAVRLKTPQEIADALNADGVVPVRPGLWTRQLVYQVISNEKYIGNNVFNRKSSKLAGRTVRNPPENWIRAEGAFEAMVSHKQFAAAQRIRRERGAVARLSDQEMLDRLVALWKRGGGLSSKVINQSRSVPSFTAYENRFGKMTELAARIGYVATPDLRLLRKNSALRRAHPKIIASVVALIRESGAKVRIEPDSELLIVDDKARVSIIVARHNSPNANNRNWTLRYETFLNPDFTLLICLARGERQVEQYLLLPRHIFNSVVPIRYNRQIEAALNAYRSPDLRALLPIR